jgi:hypothetical protein
MLVSKDASEVWAAGPLFKTQHEQTLKSRPGQLLWRVMSSTDKPRHRDMVVDMSVDAAFRDFQPTFFPALDNSPLDSADSKDAPAYEARHDADHDPAQRLRITVDVSVPFVARGKTGELS